MSEAGVLGPRGPEGTGVCMGDTPSLKEIEQLLNTGRPSCNHVDEVWPNLFLGDLVTAHNRFVLWKMGVTHVLNAAHGTAYSHGGQDFYGATIDYYGVPAHDLPSFDISQFFFSAAQFIHNALNTPGEDFEVVNKLIIKHLSGYQPLLICKAKAKTLWVERWAARSKATLQSLNITHILNAADGPYSINTGAKYYEDLQIEYYGVEAFDDPSFDLSIFFCDAANFISKALNTSGGKVFVHCAMGVSRSASLVLAFLMIHENMTLVDALKTVSAHRDICPNSGFLSQLRDLDIKLNEERKGTRESATKEL
ncbi:dual specificity protein phosphatase 13-like [Grus japonensis]|uniref:Dual specificity protein phosphatase 13-like n=1 Tax=Grus japonensis TaxID=30415 RepID=A0ABC9X6E8_GRUJA